MATNKKSHKVIIIVSIIVVALIIAVIVGVVLWKTSNSKIENDDTALVSSEVEDTTEYEVPTTEIFTTADPEEDIVITKTPSSSSATLSGGGNAELSVSYPVLESSMYGEMVDKFNTLISTEVEQFKNEYAKAISDESYADADSLSYELTYDIYKEDKGIISILIKENAYLGGAHSNTKCKAVNYNLNSGESLSINDVLGSDPETCNNLIKSKILNIMRETPEKYFSVEDNALDETYSDANFLITATGIVIFFQEYDIAPFAEGTPTFELSYTDLSEIMPF